MALSDIHLTPQLVQAVRDAVDIVDIASEHTKLRKTGRRYTGLCPLHREKTPSFSVDPDEGLFYCFGCGQGGDAIKLYMLLAGDDFPTAIEALAQRYGIPLPSRPKGAARGSRGPDLEPVLKAAAEFFVDQLRRSRDTQKYLDRRQVSREIQERFGLGYAPDGWRHLVGALHPRFGWAELEAAGLTARSERGSSEPYDRFRNRLMFPIRSASGRLVGFGGRTLGDDRAKYINTSETDDFRKGRLLYGLDVSKREIREAGSALLVEGYFDVIGAIASGVSGAVASMGTALTTDQARLLARYCHEVVVGYDADSAGEQAFRRCLPELLRQGLTVRRARFGEGHDPDSLRLAEGPEAVVAAVDAAADAVELELERLIPRQALSSPAVQARAARAVGELLKPIPDSVLRYSYSRRAASSLGVPVELLWRRLDTGEPEAKVEKGPAEAISAVRSLEEKVLLLLFSSSEEEMPPVSDLPASEVFFIPVCRNIYRAFYDLYRDGRGERPSAQDVLASVSPQGAEVDLVARLLLEGATVARSGELQESLRRLSRRWLQQRQKELSGEIVKAQRAGDSELLERLVREKSALSRALHGKSSESNGSSR